MSAIAAVESVLGRGSVMRVEPDELVWAAEIAHRLGRTRQSVRLLMHGKRGPGGFPRPAATATRNPLWRWSEVADWFERYERQADGRPGALGRHWRHQRKRWRLAGTSGRGPIGR